MNNWRDTPWLGSPFKGAGGGGGGICDPYTGQMTVGQSGNLTGYRTSVYGLMVPATINGATIFEIASLGLNNGAGNMTMTGNAEIPDGAGRNLWINFGTYPVREWDWNSGGGDYTPTILDVGWENYMESQVGNIIDICINWGDAGGEG